MSVGVESNPYIGVPNGSQEEHLSTDVAFHFKYLSDDRVEVHHPFHGTVILGNGSVIDNSAADRAGVVLFQQMPYLIDSKKLNRPAEFETRTFAGQYAELSHCFSLGMFGHAMGGGPLDIIDGFYNDASKTHDGHQSDDNYQGHGHEDLHDKIRASFFERAGIIDALEDAGALVRRKAGLFIGTTRLTLNTLLDEDEVVIRRSFLSNKHVARRLDADRFQYSAEEALLFGYAKHLDGQNPGRVPLAMAEVALDSIARKIVLHDDEGDQLVFSDPETAMAFSMEYAEQNSEHWCEPVQDAVNDILNLAERYFFICDHPVARQFQDFYPRDYLHTSATLMYERYWAVAQDDRAMAWFLNTAKYIAQDQRTKSTQYLRDINPYSGPNPPDGMKLRRLDEGERVTTDAHVANSVFYIDLPRGKMRTITPRFLNGGGETRPLDDYSPEFKDFCQDRHAWIGDYHAEIDMPEREDAEAVHRALSEIEKRWPRALITRPEMPPRELQQSIREANEYTLRHGSHKRLMH